MRLQQEEYELILDLEPGDSEDGYQVVSNKIVDKRRWVVVHEVIFCIGKEAWGFTYETGATEYQETEWPAYVDCYRMVAVPSVTYVRA
jgi:hypothetical protein